jgi:DUF2950 family protein
MATRVTSARSIGAMFALLIALYAQICTAQQPASHTLASAEAASRALPVQERRDRERLARNYDEMQRLAMEEVLARRIGENELAAIATSRTLVTQEQDKRPQTNAQLFVNVGKGDGVVPFHGYYFRRLEGEHRVLAYPAEYRVTGVMTFLADNGDAVYEEDLGPDTAEVAKNIEKPGSTSTWHRVE